MSDIEKFSYDVLIIGAGGSGLRAAIAAHEAGLKVAVICKSLFGKAHTVMAEGGCAAAMGNANSNDNWMVHFRDTMRGGKFLNNWRMAELHAKEAPDRVWELETYGALFDRTKDGRITHTPGSKQRRASKRRRVQGTRRLLRFPQIDVVQDSQRQLLGVPVALLVSATFSFCSSASMRACRC